jgi:hypothetical protein
MGCSWYGLNISPLFKPGLRIGTLDLNEVYTKFWLIVNFYVKIIAYRVRIEAAFASSAKSRVLLIKRVLLAPKLLTSSHATLKGSFVVSYSANVLSSSSIKNKNC